MQMDAGKDGKRLGRAVVIGGSMAGLVAARVLSDHFEEVVVVERDPIPDALVDSRKGVPQGRHLHALLARGGQLLEQLFPGLIAGAVAEGALLIDWGRDMAWHHFGGWKVRHDSGIELLCSSRPFLESQVRRRLFERANVRRLDRHDVIALRSSADRRRVTGVEVRARESEADEGEGSGGGEALAAELVVDAGGRGSKTLAWLEALGHAKPPESSVRVQVGYSSRVFDLPEPERFDWRGAYVVGGPADKHRIGAVFPVEGKRAIVVLAGLLGDYPPDDDEGFVRFADSLPAGAIGSLVHTLQPISPIATHRFPAHRRRHFERTPPPDGYVVLGDALVSFNPIYGQGMTTAALAGELLGKCIAERRGQGDAIAGLSRRFHVAAGKLADVPWLLSTSEDFRNPAIEGARPPGYAALRWYTERVHRAARVDPVVYGSFLQVMHMLAGPESLFDPRIAWRALVGARRADSLGSPSPAPLIASR